MPIYSIFLVNTDSGCDTFIEQQLNVSSPSSYLIKLDPVSNAVGPFDIFSGSTGSTPIYSALTRIQMTTGIVINF